MELIDVDLATDRLRAFLAVAREGGFSRGARKLGQTQSSVSQAVAALERQLGEALFVRDGRETYPTEAGRVLRLHAERAFTALGAARVELQALRTLSMGTLEVGTTDTLAAYVLPPVFGRFRAAYPGVDLRLDNRPSPTIAARVAAREVELGVVSLPLPPGLRLDGRPADDALRTERLTRQRDLLICAPSHPLAAKRRVTLRDLAAHPLLLLDRTTATRAFLDARFAAAGVRPRITMEMNGVEVLKRFVELEFGVSIVPEASVAREVTQGTLAARRIAGVPARTVALITPTVGPLSRAARAFIDVARDTFAP